MKRIITPVAAIALAIGVAACGTSNNSALISAQHKVKAEQGTIAILRGQVASLQSQVTTLLGKLTTAQTAASHATSIASAKAAAAYASRKAALDARSKALNAQAKSLAAETGNLEANQISSDGTYVVGHDIKAGTWHTPGDGGQTTQACYYQTDNTSNYSSISNIGSNANFDGPETVSVSGYYAFEISGPCTWYLVG